MPVTGHAHAVARGESAAYYANASVAGNHVRIITFPYQPSFAIQIARPLDETDRSLARIRWLLILIATGGTLIACGLGLVVSRAALAPVRRLTRATETVTVSGRSEERRVGEEGQSR